MKLSKFLTPLAVLILGTSFLAWQRARLESERARAAAAAAALATAARPEAAPPRSAAAIKRGKPVPRPAVDPADATPPPPLSPSGSPDAVNLATLTGGVEDALDLGQGWEQILQTSILEAVAALTPEQLRATFAFVTRQIGMVPPNELARGKASNAEQMRAMILLTPLMGRLQRESPETVLAWMASPELPPFLRQQAGRFVEETVRSLAQADPEAALKWLEQKAATLPEGDRAWPAALGALAVTDLPRALRVATDRGILPETLKSAIPALTTPAARQQWSEAVLTIDDPARRGRRWSALVEHEVATGGWQSALAVLSADLPAEARTAENFDSIVRAGVSAAPTDLAHQLTALPEETRARLMPEFVSRWAERDYNATAAWLGTAPANAPWRDVAVASFVGKIRAVDPEAARTWAHTIKDPALRAQVAAF